MTALVRGLGLFLGWRHKLFCMHVYKELMLCKWIYDIKPRIDPGPSQAWSCEFFRWFSVTLTAHKKSSFQAKTIILSPFYSQKHKDFFKRKTFFGVIGTLRNLLVNKFTCFTEFCCVLGQKGAKKWLSRYQWYCWAGANCKNLLCSVLFFKETTKEWEQNRPDFYIWQHNFCMLNIYLWMFL